MLRRTRLLALGGLVLIALLYWKPLRTYEHTRSVLERRQADVARLRLQQQQLRRRRVAQEALACRRGRQGDRRASARQAAARVPPRHRPLPLRAPRGYRASAVRRRGDAVSDAVLAHVPAPCG